MRWVGFAGFGTLLLIGPMLAFGGEARNPVGEHVVDIGTTDDEWFIGQGIYQREGPNPKSAVTFYRENSMRWFGNRWTMRLPVFARSDNRVTFLARFSRQVQLTLGDGWQVTLEGRGDDQDAYSFVLPQAAVGDRERIEVHGVCSPPYTAPPDRRDARQLAMAVAGVTVRIADSRQGETVADRATDAERRPSAPEHWINLGLEGDRARHELTMRTFMLAGLTYGITPWHGGHIQPAEIGIRVHRAVQRREAFFSQDALRHVGVVLSQNTHDFYGHLPATTNLDDYRDAVLGAWLLLTERHAPFRWVFDNQLKAGDLDGYRVLLLNVSAFYPGGDTAFRGLGAEPVTAPPVASDAQIVQGGRVARINRPVRDAQVVVAGRQPASARRGIAGIELQPAADGSYRIPEVDVHDVLVFEFP
jgi:hypothetical protein